MINNKTISIGTGAIILLLSIGVVVYTEADTAQEVNIEEYIYGTYVGGSNDDVIRDLVTDSQNNFIITGQTQSSDFPVLNAHQELYAGEEEDPHGVFGDAIISKFSNEGQLLWSTYLGGTSNEAGNNIVVDAFDNVVVLGVTKSRDFPTTVDAYQQNYSGYYDLFISKFSPNGDLIYSSYLGTSEEESITDAAIDSDGNFIISGVTSSANFPTTIDAQQPAFGGLTDSFLMKLAPDGSTLYSTFLGGSSHDWIDNIILDKDGNIITSGGTESSDYPITENAFQDSLQGTERDFIITKYDDSGQLIYSTYFGGSQADDCFGLGVDSTGSIITTGRTSSQDFPTKNAYQDAYKGDEVDAFVSKLGPDNEKITFSSYFGGTGWDTIYHVSVDESDNILVSGGVDQDDFPIMYPIQQGFGGEYDTILMALSPDGKPFFSSYLGGSDGDYSLAQYYSNDQLFIAGTTNSIDFPISNSSFVDAISEEREGFIFKFDIQAYLSTIPTLETQTEKTEFFSIELLSISTFVVSRLFVRKRRKTIC
ncbi:MAG: SBBP repeat-containing protein [Candidatus Kariarchaeaceae archaeon]|jgi:hypothetical protein